MKHLYRTLRSFSVNKKQMDNFDKIKGWWEPEGPMQMLYEYNYHRVAFLVNNLKKQNKISSPPTPLKNLRVLDVGCGAGILSESMARLGADVTALDPNTTSIQQALNHQKGDESIASIKYKEMRLEQLLKTESNFDLVTSMEVLEHVQNPKLFVRNLSLALKDNGFMLLSTISRHWYTYLTHVFVAEYIMNVVPKGTHDYSKFINPKELDGFLEEAGCESLSKLFLDVNIDRTFKECPDGSNYIVFAQKSTGSKDKSQ